MGLSGAATTRRAVLGGGAAGLVAGPAVGAAGPLRLRAAVGSEALVMESAPRFAGAISSLVYRGRQHVDSADHGRLFQSAIHFDGWGECLNPTQGGGSGDRRRSTSRVLASAVGEGRWSVTTRMAYWLRPGQRCVVPEGPAAVARNRRRLSDVTVTVTHRFGVLPAPNAVLTDVVYSLPTGQESAVVEALGCYMPTAFGRLYVFGEGRLQPSDAHFEYPDPYALTTEDGGHALSIFSPRGSPRPRFSGLYLGEVHKVNAVFRPAGPLAAGPHAFRLAWAIGTLAEVEAALRACG